MGYIKSAPYFCASTETIADLMNHSWALADLAPAHPLEQFTRPPEPAPPDPTLLFKPTRAPLAYIDVFIDDFSHPTPRHARPTAPGIFHSINLLFRPKDAQD
jgi:hypothetical protein